MEHVRGLVLALVLGLVIGVVAGSGTVHEPTQFSGKPQISEGGSPIFLKGGDDQEENPLPEVYSAVVWQESLPGTTSGDIWVALFDNRSQLILKEVVPIGSSDLARKPEVAIGQDGRTLIVFELFLGNHWVPAFVTYLENGNFDYGPGVLASYNSSHVTGALR